MTLLSRVFNNSLLFYVMFVPAITVMLISCAPVREDSPYFYEGEDIEEQAADAEDTIEYNIEYARKQTGAARQRYLLKAVDLMLDRGKVQSAQTFMKNLNQEGIDSSLAIDAQIITARIALLDNRPARALELLPAQEQLNLDQFIAASHVRSGISVGLGRHLEAVRIRVGLDRYLKDAEQRQKNHESIFFILSLLPSITLADESSDDVVVQGWLDLARIMRRAQTNIDMMQQDILNWGTQYPQHPVSNAFIDKLINEYTSLHKTVSHIAVMLPMQGDIQPIADTIKSGFLSAYYNDAIIVNRPVINFYDTGGDNTDFMQLYQMAVDEGAQMIIGPLDKDMINTLAGQEQLPVPVLTLNYAEQAQNETGTHNVYQFGLLPEDEARHVAELAVLEERLQAVILVPDGEWGERLYQAFRQRYEQLGGKVLNVQRFVTSSDDYSTPIKRLLNLDESRARLRNLERMLGTDLKFAPYRRQDIDMIFMGATHHSARGIIPAFRFHHAGDLPVYSTSHVYTGSVDTSADGDLDGLMFCDMPWTLVTDNRLKTIFNTNWQQQRDYTRLFALGIDAYHIMRNLDYLRAMPWARFAGETGNIYIDENLRLHRELLWAKFRNGKPRYFDITTFPSRKRNEADQS